MSTITKTIDISPDRSIMRKMGQQGYSLAQAVSELVDNSIDARSNDHTLIVEILLNHKRSTISIADNGVGMDEETAQNCLRLGHSSKQDQLGEFGVGLKTACINLGDRFRIETSQHGSEEEYIVEYDDSEWMAGGDWGEHPFTVQSGANKNYSGTKVTIEKVNRRITYTVVSTLRKDLATRFAPFLENGEVKIKVNTRWCKPTPIALNKDICPPSGKEDFSMSTENGFKIRGWRGMLKNGSKKGEYGFRVFRRGRLIKQFEKIGFTESPDVNQMIGEIHLDHVPVTHNKRELIEDAPEYQEIVQEGGKFWRYMHPFVEKVRSHAAVPKVSEATQMQVDRGMEDLAEVFNRLQRHGEFDLPDTQRKQRSEEGEEGSVYAEKRGDKNIAGEADQEVSEEREDSIAEKGVEVNKKERSPRKSDGFLITVRGESYRINHTLADLKSEGGRKEVVVDQAGVITVFTNTSFALYKSTKDPADYILFNVAEGIAEFTVKEGHRSPLELVSLRDQMLDEYLLIENNRRDVAQRQKRSKQLEKKAQEKKRQMEVLQKEMQEVETEAKKQGVILSV